MRTVSHGSEMFIVVKIIFCTESNVTLVLRRVSYRCGMAIFHLWRLAGLKDTSPSAVRTLSEACDGKMSWHYDVYFLCPPCIQFFRASVVSGFVAHLSVYRSNDHGFKCVRQNVLAWSIYKTNVDETLPVRHDACAPRA